MSECDKDRQLWPGSSRFAAGTPVVPTALDALGDILLSASAASLAPTQYLELPAAYAEGVRADLGGGERARSGPPGRLRGGGGAGSEWLADIYAAGVPRAPPRACPAAIPTRSRHTWPSPTRAARQQSTLCNPTSCRRAGGPPSGAPCRPAYRRACRLTCQRASSSRTRHGCVCRRAFGLAVARRHRRVRTYSTSWMGACGTGMSAVR